MRFGVHADTYFECGDNRKTEGQIFGRDQTFLVSVLRLSASFLVGKSHCCCGCVDTMNFVVVFVVVVVFVLLVFFFISFYCVHCITTNDVSPLARTRLRYMNILYESKVFFFSSSLKYVDIVVSLRSLSFIYLFFSLFFLTFEFLVFYLQMLSLYAIAFCCAITVIVFANFRYAYKCSFVVRRFCAIRIYCIVIYHGNGMHNNNPNILCAAAMLIPNNIQTYC